jgi:hypothetical protein
MEAGDRSLAVVPCAVYRFGPDAGQRLRWAVPDAALCVMAWVVSSVGRRCVAGTGRNTRSPGDSAHQ